MTFFEWLNPCELSKSDWWWSLVGTAMLVPFAWFVFSIYMEIGG